MYRLTKYDHEKHLRFLYETMMDAEEQSLFLQHVVCNSLKEFDRWLESKLTNFYHEFYVIEKIDIKNNHYEFIGIVYSYEARLQDGFCKMAIYVRRSWRSFGLGAKVGLCFINHLFKYYPINRIHCDVYDYNKMSKKCLMTCGFEKTGVIKEYRYFCGHYHDLALFSISRHSFITRWGSIVQRLKISWQIL